MRVSYRTKHEGDVETLKLKKDPFLNGLGHYEDVDGIVWDVACLVGSSYTKNNKAYVNARPVTNSPYYNTSTYGHSFGFHRWKPFYVEVVEENKNK